MSADTPTMTTHLRKHRTFLIAAAIFVCASLLASLIKPVTSDTPLAVNNPAPAGAQALARLLEDEGVTIDSIASLKELRAHVDHYPGERVTVALIHPGSLDVTARSWLGSSGADVTVLGTRYEELTGLAPSTSVGEGSASPLEARCTDPDALAAGSISKAESSLTLDASAPDVVAPTPDSEAESSADAMGCFPMPQKADAPEDPAHYVYVVTALADGATLRLIADSSLATNAHLDEQGNAALLIRALGHHQHLLWFDAREAQITSAWDQPTLPPWFPVVIAQLIMVLLVAAVAKGRRFGRLVTEPLPVIVRASETTRGRGRLYRAAGARHRAARSLRAGTLVRIGHQLGLPHYADARTVVTAIASATNLPESFIDAAFYGPPPTSDRSLVELAVQLERIESEVSHS